MVFNCNMNDFSRLTSIINLYYENMNLEMTIKKLGSVYKLRVGRATGKRTYILFWPYSIIIQTLNIALCLKAGRNYGQTDGRTIPLLDALSRPYGTFRPGA